MEKGPPFSGSTTMKYVFLIFTLLYMGCSRPIAAPPATAGTFPTIRCTEHPLPEFTLGADRTPSGQEQAELCGCIWSHLGAHDRAVATRLFGGTGSMTASSSTQTFPIRLGKAIGSCSSSAR